MNPVPSHAPRTRLTVPGILMAVLLVIPSLLRGEENAMQRGSVAFRNGDYDLAIASFTEALKLNPKDAAACNMRAVAHAKKGEFDPAIADYTEALRIDPKLVTAWFMRGKARQEKGDHDLALADFNEAVRLDPKNMAACNRLAWFLATCPKPALRDGRRAVDFARKACEISDWKAAIALDTLAAACAEAGDFPQAVEWEAKYLKTALCPERSAEDATARLALYKARKPYHAEK